MVIHESSKYKQSYKKIIVRKHMTEEGDRILIIEKAIHSSDNLYELMKSNISKLYKIEKKKANLKEYYTARLNRKMRLIMKPVGKHTYNEIEIDEIDFVDIDNTHYKEG